MTEFPITLEEFKLFFMRDAGVEYQPYPTFVKTTYDLGAKVNHNDKAWTSDAADNITEPGAEEATWTEIGDVDPQLEEWVAPTAYQTDDKVVAVVNYKPGVWVSKADDNYTVPAQNNENWEYAEDEEEFVDDWVLDSDILRAMGEASFKFNPNLFTGPKGKMVFLYLTMFFLVYDKRMAATGLSSSTSTSGPVIHRTVGKMSVSYAESKLYKNYPSYEFLSSNDYGRKAFNLMLPYLRAGIRVFIGGNTGV